MSEKDTSLNFNLAFPFYRQACTHPDLTALHVDGVSYSYEKIADLAARVAFAVGGTQKVSVLASRSLGTYLGVLGASWCGAAYVPLNPKHPTERLIYILSTVRPDALVVDEAGRACLTPELRAAAPSRIVDLSAGFDCLPDNKLDEPVKRAADDLAYIIFTSGTTGRPKGVMISLGSVAQFLAAMECRFSPCPTDRVSQTSDLTFDVSVFEMFVSWKHGASVEVVPVNQLMAPSRFIVDRKITVWSSVPSIAAFMKRIRMLKRGAFPSIRYSVFAGEALPYPLAEAWQEAAPSSLVENLYGPTEATVYCIGATVGPAFPPTPGRNTVPSGFPLPRMDAAILDEALKPLPAGKEGQLAISGGQLAQGYFKDPELTLLRFPLINGKTWYLTGDLARQDESGVFHHLGRIDNQIKVLGQRVELEEIEAHLRQISGSEHVAAIAWPIQDGIVKGIVAFTSETAIPAEELLENLARVVPHYMVPRQIHQIDALPLNPNGKVDRRALAQLLDHSQSTEEKN